MKTPSSSKTIGNFVGRGDTKGCTFTQLKRHGDVALYLRQTPHGPTYEVIRVQRHKEDRIVSGKLIARAGAEFYPSSASFGKNGWYYPERPQAEIKFAALTAEAAPKEPLCLLEWEQPCDQCGHETGTKVLFMQAGYGNACSVCGRLRRGKPYLSKAEFNALKPDAAQGGHHEQLD